MQSKSTSSRLKHPEVPLFQEKLLRVLCAEDDPRDLKLMIEVLSRAGYRLEIDPVDDPEVFRKRLLTRDYEVIVCDFNLKAWTAMDALAILNEAGKDLPLVVVSGSLGDEAAVECIKLGATDYVLKDRMARLPLAIQRALEAKASRDEKLRADFALRQREEQYRMLFEGNPHPIWVFDSSTLEILSVNAAAVAHFGYPFEEFLKLSASDLRPPEEVGRFLTRLANEIDKTMPMGVGGAFKLRKKSGEIFLAEIAGSPIVFEGRAARLVLVNDVTERNSLQAQLLQPQKMESLGRLAGGVAHDLNNLMGVVLGYGELTLELLEQHSPLRHNVEGMQRAAGRAVSVVKQLLAFSRKQIQQPRMLNLNTVVKDMQELLQRLIGEDVRLKFAPAEELGTIRADPGQLEQIIMNLAVNARDAMPHGGKLTIQTANIVLEADDSEALVECPAGAYVTITVTDTGCGMDSAVQARIFEPFFTTKDPGKGTGLGLATVYGIVRQSGGSISVHSKIGEGTTFKICLPQVEGDPQPYVPEKSRGEIPRGSETVLLVEDAHPLRELSRRFLQETGYNVLVAEDGIAAMTVAEEYRGRIHLLLTDVVMPGLSGPILAQNLALTHPDMRVLFVSGYTDESLGTHGMLEEGISILEKPFTRSSLLRKLREVLDAK